MSAAESADARVIGVVSLESHGFLRHFRRVAKMSTVLDARDRPRSCCGSYVVLDAQNSVSADLTCASAARGVRQPFPCTPAAIFHRARFARSNVISSHVLEGSGYVEQVHGCLRA